MARWDFSAGESSLRKIAVCRSFESEPEPHLGGRRFAIPRGKVLGGSSSINGLVYVRGNPHDFDRWEEEGAAGWGYRNVLPYFRRAEGRRRPDACGNFQG